MVNFTFYAVIKNRIQLRKSGYAIANPTYMTITGLIVDSLGIDMAEGDRASADAVKNKAGRRVNKLNPVHSLADLLDKTQQPAYLNLSAFIHRVDMLLCFSSCPSRLRGELKQIIRVILSRKSLNTYASKPAV